MTGVAVGLDLGTSALKGVAVSEGGMVLAQAAVPYPTERPARDRAEQDPADWERAASAALAALAAKAPPPWAGVGLSAMLPTMVLHDGEGAAVGPAHTWEDARGEDVAERLRNSDDGAELYRRTGQRVDGRYLVPMAGWVREHEPERFAHARVLVGAKDHLFGWLTGEVVTDPSTAAGYGCFDLATGAWADDLLVAVGDAGPAAGLTLPPVVPANTTRPVRAELAGPLGLGRGTPVALGCADSVAAALGAGADEPGDVVSIWGTSTVILGVANRPEPDETRRYLITPMATGGAWGLEMDLVSTGSAFAWLAELLGIEAEEVAAVAAGAEPGARGLTFLPYVGGGEQGALWDPSLSGTLAGISIGHGRADLARALSDGIVLEARRCLGVLGEHGLAGVVHVTGHAARTASLDRDLADATGRRVMRAKALEVSASAFGAARLAGAAGGLAIPALPFGDPVDPRPGSREIWDELWVLHEALRSNVFGRRVEDGGEPRRR